MAKCLKVQYVITSIQDASQFNDKFEDIDSNMETDCSDNIVELELEVLLLSRNNIASIQHKKISQVGHYHIVLTIRVATVCFMIEVVDVIEVMGMLDMGYNIMIQDGEMVIR